MRVMLNLFAMVVMLHGATSALALPAAALAEGTLAMQNIYSMANLSSLFGWQLAGSQIAESELWTSCSAMTSKWKAIGLDSDLIKVPLCNATDSHRAVNVVPHTVVYATNVFVSQLLSAFNNTNAFAYMCQNIGFNMIASFAINDMDVVNAVCHAGGVQTKPRPEETMPWAPKDAVQAARNTASILFGLILAAGAKSNAQLTTACARAPLYVPYLNKEQLNGTLVQSTLCNIQSPISTFHARESVQTWTGRYFITVIENISHVPGWLDWLCQNISPNHLNSAGLDGYGIEVQICSDSTDYPHDK